MYRGEATPARTLPSVRTIFCTQTSEVTRLGHSSLAIKQLSCYFTAPYELCRSCEKARNPILQDKGHPSLLPDMGVYTHGENIRDTCTTQGTQHSHNGHAQCMMI